MGDGRAADDDQVGLDQHLSAAGRGPAVVGNAAKDGRCLARNGGRSGGGARVGGGELGAADAKEGCHEREGEHRWADRDREGQTGNHQRDGGGADRWLRRCHHHRCRYRDRPCKRNHERWEMGQVAGFVHSVR